MFMKNSHQVEIMLIVGYDDVHIINKPLTTDEITIQDVHGSAEARIPLGQYVILGQFLVTNKHIMGRCLFPLHWSHPPPESCFKC
jgi:hypothetical protein